jgi:nucleolar protein 56
MARKTIATAWHGTYLLDGDGVLREIRAPSAVDELVERAARRATGATTAEEEALLAERHGEPWRSKDRRLVRDGVTFDPAAPAPPRRPEEEGRHRQALLEQAARALAAAWDPSVHVEEAVRALRDLDRAANLLGERIASWAARDIPDVEGEGPEAAARAVLERVPAEGLAPDDPAVVAARRRLAELLLAVTATRAAVDEAVRAAAPVRTPNLHRLLGPELAARLVAQAGGLDRLAHLPASTVQVLGAERAFFEHLRGRAPPPRHGLLFLHPAVQSAPRAQRGKLARALAAKAAIAARLDRAGAPVRPALATAFEARRAAIRAAGAAASRGKRRGLRPPLDGAPDDR